MQLRYHGFRNFGCFGAANIDADPYPVLVDGGIVYVIDGYTTTDRYPYAQPASVAELPRKSGLRHDLNYVRNSVKATIDAFKQHLA